MMCVVIHRQHLADHVAAACLPVKTQAGTAHANFDKDSMPRTLQALL